MKILIFSLLVASTAIAGEHEKQFMLNELLWIGDQLEYNFSDRGPFDGWADRGKTSRELSDRHDAVRIFMGCVAEVQVEYEIRGCEAKKIVRIKAGLD